MKFYLTLILAIFSFNLISQELISRENKKTKKIFSSTISFQKMDVFSNVNFDFQLNHWNCTAGFGTGMNRTFYQGRFFPQVQVGGSHLFCFGKSKMRIGPEIQLLVSSFRIAERHYFLSPTIGYKLQIGYKWMFVHHANIGLLQENFRNVSGDFSHAYSTNYQLSIGIGYALD